MKEGKFLFKWIAQVINEERTTEHHHFQLPHEFMNQGNHD